MISFSGINFYGWIAGPGGKGSESAANTADVSSLKEAIRHSVAVEDPDNIYFEFSQAITKCENYAKSDKKGGVELFNYLITAAASLKDPDSAARFLKSLANRIPGLELGKTETQDLLISILARAKNLPPLQQASVYGRVAAVQAGRKLIGKPESDRSLSMALAQTRATFFREGPGHSPIDHIRKAYVLMEIAGASPKGTKDRARQYLFYDEALRAVEEMSPIMYYNGHPITAAESNDVHKVVESFGKDVIGSMKKAGFKNEEIARLFNNRKVGLDATKVSDYLRTITH